MKAEVVKTLVESTGQEQCDQKYSHTLLIVHKGRCFKVCAEATRKDLHRCNIRVDWNFRFGSLG
jgi:hypothetical protein